MALYIFTRAPIQDSFPPSRCPTHRKFSRIRKFTAPRKMLCCVPGMPLNHKRRFQSMAIKSCHFPDTSVVFRCNRNDTVALHSPAENYIPGFYRFRLCLAGSFLPWDNQLAALDIDSS